MCARQDTAWSVAVPFTVGYPIWLSELAFRNWRHARRRSLELSQPSIGSSPQDALAGTGRQARIPVT